MLGLVVEKHGVNVAVNVATAVGVDNFLISSVAGESVLETFGAGNFVEPWRVVIRADARQIYVRLDFVAGNDELHRKTPDDVVGGRGIDEPFVVARQIRDNVDFAGIELVEQIRPVVENDVLKFARHVIFEKFHVLVAVADGMPGAVFRHEAGVDDVTDLQNLALNIIFGGACKVRQIHRCRRRRQQNFAFPPHFPTLQNFKIIARY